MISLLKLAIYADVFHKSATLSGPATYRVGPIPSVMSVPTVVNEQGWEIYPSDVWAHEHEKEEKHRILSDGLRALKEILVSGLYNHYGWLTRPAAAFGLLRYTASPREKADLEWVKQQIENHYDDFVANGHGNLIPPILRAINLRIIEANVPEQVVTSPGSEIEDMPASGKGTFQLLQPIPPPSSDIEEDEPKTERSPQTLRSFENIAKRLLDKISKLS